MPYRLLNWFLFVLCLTLSLSVVRSFLNLSHQGNIIEEAQEKLRLVKERQDELWRELAKVESKEYIEKEARNKLNLSKEGEIVLLLPSISPVTELTPTPVDTSPNWQKWLNVFR